ncbi:PTS sugar transporter subunit IIA [Lactiplantibacillus carotarum]|uniref:PTS sugar transporter subunit IIA n=1 Tax=Lactiplantibacillus carotarum TaxID=2993456 RepID=UPI00298EE702|nr:fructose PTS transporter subunit IIA [Lactiplantibacillus carotarum]
MNDLIKDNIDLDADVKTRKEALYQMSTMLEKHGVVTDKDAFYQAILDREAIGPTGMENGIAIPHGESDVVKDAAIAVYKTRENLEWESLDGKPINLIFLLVVPTKGRNINHLKILSHLSAALTHKEVQQDLLLENNVNDFKEILRKAGGM